MLLRDCIEALNLSVAEAAQHLQVPEELLAAICRQEAPITADMAVRIEQAFGGGADAWLGMQAAHDLAEARRSSLSIANLTGAHDTGISMSAESFDANELLKRFARAAPSRPHIALIADEFRASWHNRSSTSSLPSHTSARANASRPSRNHQGLDESRDQPPRRSANGLHPLMPFGDEFESVYEDLIFPALSEAGFITTRADQFNTQQSVMQDIIQSIGRSALIIADLTGGNPNVYYELGIAHGLRRQVILMTQEIESLPFDLRSYRVIEYSLHLRDARRASARLRELAAGVRDGTALFGNPVSDFLDPKLFSSRALRSDEDGAMLGIVDYQERFQNCTTTLHP